jgi:hypothetical protein
LESMEEVEEPIVKELGEEKNVPWRADGAKRA